MKLRALGIITGLGLATALASAIPADAAPRDGHRRFAYSEGYRRSGRPYRVERSHAFRRDYRPYVRGYYRPYYRPYVRSYAYPYPYAYYDYDPYYAPAYVPYRPYCGPRVRVGFRFRF